MQATTPLPELMGQWPHSDHLGHHVGGRVCKLPHRGIYIPGVGQKGLDRPGDHAVHLSSLAASWLHVMPTYCPESPIARLGTMHVPSRPAGRELLYTTTRSA